MHPNLGIHYARSSISLDNLKWNWLHRQSAATNWGVRNGETLGFGIRATEIFWNLRCCTCVSRWRWWRRSFQIDWMYELEGDLVVRSKFGEIDSTNCTHLFGRCSRGETTGSSDENPGWFGSIGDYTTQLYRDYFISHEIRIPSWSNKDFMECHVRTLITAQMNTEHEMYCCYSVRSNPTKKTHRWIQHPCTCKTERQGTLAERLRAGRPWKRSWHTITAGVFPCWKWGDFAAMSGFCRVNSMEIGAISDMKMKCKM